MTPGSRRDLLFHLFGAAASSFASAGCHRSRQQAAPLEGTVVGANAAFGHRARDRRNEAAPAASGDSIDPRRIPVLIVGGGAAGLSVAWSFERAGFRDYELVELEDRYGGTAQSGRIGNFAVPWGAHYLPAPWSRNAQLVEFLQDADVVESIGDDGEPIYREEHLCHAPKERTFANGRWHEDLTDALQLPTDEARQFQRFERQVREWISWRIDDGRSAFSLPLSQAADFDAASQLDDETASDWLDRAEFNSPALRWELDYACRDDFGMRLDETSAWAMAFYYAARSRSPEAPSQPFLTWPNGNGFLLDALAKRSRDRIRTGVAVMRIDPPVADSNSLRVALLHPSGELEVVLAGHVVWCAPQFVAARVIEGYSNDRSASLAEFEYGSWLVANLLLTNRPANVGFPPAWDNVLRHSRSLGYVSATHQLGIDHGPTAWTYYLPLCDGSPNDVRQALLSLSWSEAAEAVLSDLEQAHPEVRRLVRKLDVMKWGHAMVRARPGFHGSAHRRTAARPWRNIHFANTDLSGAPLFEEAFDHGTRAASEVLNARRLA